MLCEVSRKAFLGRNVEIGAFSKIYDNVIIEDDVVIEDHCLIGVPVRGDMKDRTLVIGSGSIIRSHTVIYEGSKFKRIETGHHVLIRENTTAGEGFRIGSFSDVEGDCKIGDYVNCHGYVHIGKGSVIGNFVWIYSLVTLTNDPLPPSDIYRPVVLEDGVVLCVGATVLAGAYIRKGAFVTSGTIVRGEIPIGAIVSGVNSEIVGYVSDLIDFQTMKRHPWMNHFFYRYPESAISRLKSLQDEIINGIKFQKQKRGK
jgi:acetyltransferase-like isoleucine patch superfamily enzyme